MISSRLSGLVWVMNIITIGMIVQRQVMNIRKLNGNLTEKGSRSSIKVWAWEINEKMVMDMGMLVVLINVIIVSRTVCVGWVYEEKCECMNNNEKRRRATSKEKVRIIRPRNWPIMGCQIEASWNFYRLHDWCHTFFSTHARTVELKFFTTRIYLTVDPDNVEHILRTNFRNYPKGKRTIEKMKDLLGDGIFNADGEAWIKQRKVASAVFNGKNLKDFSIMAFRMDSVCLLTTLHSATINGNPINIQDLLLSMTMDSISRVGFGIHGGRLYTMRSTFTSSFDKANAMISRRFVNVWWKAHKIFRLGTEKALREELASLNSFTSEVIASRRAELIDFSTRKNQSNKFSSKENGDLLSRLINIGGISSTEKDLRDYIMNFMLAGRDTTAVTMSWFIYNICKQPRIANKIYQEVKSVISNGGPSKNKPNSLGTFEEVADCLTFEALSRMQYLHAALTETLRLHPAVARMNKKRKQRQ